MPGCFFCKKTERDHARSAYEEKYKMDVTRETACMGLSAANTSVFSMYFNGVFCVIAGCYFNDVHISSVFFRQRRRFHCTFVFVYRNAMCFCDGDLFFLNLMLHHFSAVLLRLKV